MIDIATITESLGLAKSIVDISKSAYNLLPKGEKRDLMKQNIEEMELKLSAASATLAKALDYHLCQCTFPPQIMLWNNSDKTYVCPNKHCGRVDTLPKPVRAVWGGRDSRSRRS